MDLEQGEPPRRVVMKLSGEALAGGQGHGIDPDVAAYLARQVRRFHDAGIEAGIVLGGGNLIRGVSAESMGFSRAGADAMGMLGTVINAIAMREALRTEGLDAEVYTPFTVGTFTLVFRRESVLAYVADGGIPVFAGGTGHPFFSTDSAAALRAAEIGADIVLKGTKVDGVYDADPVEKPDAKRFTRLSFQEVLERNLRVMDQTAVSLCRESGIAIFVFDLFDEENFTTVSRGDWSRGTLIT